MNTLKSPYDLTFMPGFNSTNPTIIIADSENHRVVKMQMNNEYRMQIIAGASYHAGDKHNQFNEPRSVRFDSKGNLLVLDSNNHRVQKLAIENNDCNVWYSITANLFFIFHAFHDGNGSHHIS
jgi:hypothetical protein